MSPMTTLTLIPPFIQSAFIGQEPRVQQGHFGLVPTIETNRFLVEFFLMYIFKYLYF